MKKIDLHFHSEFRRRLNVFVISYGATPQLQHHVVNKFEFQMETYIICRRGLRFQSRQILVSSRCCFCRGRLRNVPSFKTLLLSYYSTHQIFCFATSSLPGFAEGSFTNKLLFFLCFVISLSLSLTFLTFKNLSFLIQNACSKNQLCQNNAACQSGFTIKGYRCSCPPGFEGEYCEKGTFQISAQMSL